eukprot:tig00021221_g19354.t1
MSHADAFLHSMLGGGGGGHGGHGQSIEERMVGGVLEVVDVTKAAFLRRDARNKENDVFVPPRLIRHFNLNSGDFVEGVAREPSDHYRMSRPGQRPKPELEDVYRINGISLRPELVPNKDLTQLHVGNLAVLSPNPANQHAAYSSQPAPSHTSSLGKRPLSPPAYAADTKRQDTSSSLHDFGTPSGAKNPGGGPLQIFPVKGYGFLLRHGQGQDIFVAPNVIRDYAMKDQDYVFGMVQEVSSGSGDPSKQRPHLVEVISINGQPAQRVPAAAAATLAAVGGTDQPTQFIDSGVMDINAKLQVFSDIFTSRFGFLRENAAGLHIFVDPDTIRKNNLQQGDRVTGRVSLQDLGAKKARLVEVLDVNGMHGGPAAVAAAAAAAAAAASGHAPPSSGYESYAGHAGHGYGHASAGGFGSGANAASAYAPPAAHAPAYAPPPAPAAAPAAAAPAAAVHRRDGCPAAARRRRRRRPRRRARPRPVPLVLPPATAAAPAAPAPASGFAPAPYAPVPPAAPAFPWAAAASEAPAVSGRPVAGTARAAGATLRLEGADGRGPRIAPALAARYRLQAGDEAAGGEADVPAPAPGDEGDGEGGPSAEPGPYLVDLQTAREKAVKRVPAHEATDPFAGLGDAGGEVEAKLVHGLVHLPPNEPSGAGRVVLQAYGYMHGPPAGPIIIMPNNINSYKLKEGDYVRGLAGPEDAGGVPPGGKHRFILRAVYHVDPRIL